MPPRCRLIEINCPLCGSRLVEVSQEGEADRLICPICLACAEATAARQDPATLKRGTPIDKGLRFLVDKARFPRRSGSEPTLADSPGSASASSTPAAEEPLPPVREKTIAGTF